MASTRHIRDFFELRTGFQGLIAFATEFSEEAQAFLDRQGIAQSKRAYGSKRGPYKRQDDADTNGNGAHPKLKKAAAFRRNFKAEYAARMARKGTGKTGKRSVKGNWQKQGRSTPPDTAPEPDGKHLTMQEAAKVMKCSDAAVRIWAQDGHLSKPTWEHRGNKHQPNKKVQVVLKDEVIALAAQRKKDKSERAANA